MPLPLQGPPGPGSGPAPALHDPPHKGPKTAMQVTEESDGWVRLRTINTAWDSDEEGEGERGGAGENAVEDLRNKLKVRTVANVCLFISVSN